VINAVNGRQKKRHECTNMGNVKDSNYDGTVRHVTARAGRTKYQAARFLLNRVYKNFLTSKTLVTAKTHGSHF
jgi:hypothetical protein